MKVRYTHRQNVITRPVGGGVKTVVVQHNYEGAGPLQYEAREDAYYRQNGSRPITARQERQLSRMLDRAVRTASAAAAARVASR